MRQFNKIFGIGFHKTCTTSLAQSLMTLGIPAFHWWAHDRMWEAIRNSDWEAAIWSERKAYADLPIPSFYHELDKAFPNSLFILTVRGSSEWQASLRRHMKARISMKREGQIHYSKLHGLERILYNCQKGFISLKECELAYEEHNKGVEKYFANRPDDLLMIDLTEPGQWDKMAKFLDCPVPKERFPHLNESG